MMSNQQNMNDAPLIDPACYAAATAAIRAEAVRLLESGEVVAVVGYRAGRRVGSAIPEVVVSAEAAAQLIFSPACQNNLALFLSKAKRDVLPQGKVAVVVKGCDLRALAGLIGESQLKREEVHMIGVACPGVYGAGLIPPGHFLRNRWPASAAPARSTSPRGSTWSPALCHRCLSFRTWKPRRWRGWRR